MLQDALSSLCAAGWCVGGWMGECTGAPLPAHRPAPPLPCPPPRTAPPLPALPQAEAEAGGGRAARQGGRGAGEEQPAAVQGGAAGLRGSEERSGAAAAGCRLPAPQVRRSSASLGDVWQQRWGVGEGRQAGAGPGGRGASGAGPERNLGRACHNMRDAACRSFACHRRRRRRSPLAAVPWPGCPAGWRKRRRR